MTKIVFAASLAVCACMMGSPVAGHAQQPPSPAATATASLFTPGNQVPPGKVPFTLRKAFHRLAHDRTESMPFAETRTFAISKNPLRQNGTLRSSKDHGLSLAYESAKPHVIIVDDQGLIERQPDGHERQVSIADHPELGTLTDLYLNLLRGNADKLFAYADVYFTGTAQVWQMGLIPHDANLAKRLGKVVVSGGGRDILRLENLLPNGESRTLDFGKVERNPIYPADVMQKYFRAGS